MLLITPSFYPAIHYGGPIYSTYELAKALKKIGVDVRVITTNANGDEKLKLKTGVVHKLENELPVKYYNSLDSRGTSLSMIFNLRKEIKESDLVYLISIFSPPTPFVIRLCSSLNKPLIISPRGQLGKWCLEQGNQFKKLWLRFFIQPFIHSPNQSFHWHLTSYAEQRAVLSVYPKANTFVIANGVNEELFPISDKPKDKSYYNKYTGFNCSDKKIIISMGRLQNVKGFDILIEAIKEVQSSKSEVVKEAQRHDIVLLIAGEDFGEKRNLENIIDNFELNKRVFLIGHIEGEEKLKFLHNADLFALASHHENFGMSVVEAMACGCPVVISDKVGIYKDVEKAAAGIVVKTDPESVESGIRSLIEDEKLRERISVNGVRLVQEKYNVESVADEMMKQYEKILHTVRM